MELVNLVIIITMVSTCISWAIRKRKEIESTTIDIEGHNFLVEEERNNVFSDEADLRYTSEIFQKTIRAMLRTIMRISAVVFLGMSIIVWVRHQNPKFGF